MTSSHGHIQKVKAENKYFKAMADKAAVEQQNLPFQRKIEKQAKVLEKISEAEKLSTAEVVGIFAFLLDI